MKLFIAAALGILISTTANANPPDPEPPVRMAKLTGEIKKYTSTGKTTTPKGESVCKLEGEIPVYPPWIMGQTKARSIKTVATCDTALKNRKFKVSFMADLTMTEAKDGKPEGKKLSIFMLYLNEKGDKPFGSISMHASGDRDALHIGTGFASPQNLMKDRSEYLSITADVEDLNQ